MVGWLSLLCVWRGLYLTSSALLLLLVLSWVLPASLESCGWLVVGLGRGWLSWVRAEQAAVSRDAILLHWPSESSATAGSSLSSLRGPLAWPAPCTGGGSGTDDRWRLFLGGRLTLSSPTLNTHTQAPEGTHTSAQGLRKRQKQGEMKGGVLLRGVVVPGSEEGAARLPLD